MNLYEFYMDYVYGLIYMDYILYEFTKLSPNFALLSVIGTITLHL